MKRTDDNVDFDLYAALFNDIAAWDGNLRKELDVDYQRLVRSVNTRGISFIMIEMPEAGKILDRSLSSGRISSIDLPVTFGKVVDNGAREFLSCLFEKIFDGSGYLYPSVDPTSVFFLRQVLYLAKKVRKECNNATILAEVEEFVRIDSRLRSPSLGWISDDLCCTNQHLSFEQAHNRSPDLFGFDTPRVPSPLLKRLDEVCGIVFSQFPELDWREIVPKHGPGAVADARTGTDKYRFPNWPKKLEEQFPYAYFAQHRENLSDDEERTYSLNEPPARLLAVPKTLKSPRLIASEPIAHQYLQQGLMRWIRKHLPLPLRTCIDFKSQLPSRQLCLTASRDGILATVDLSSASDRLSCWTVERALRVNPPLLRALHACRTRWLVNATGSGERFFIKLKKFAAQGAAITFPVQSMIYACMAIAALSYEYGSRLNRASVLKLSREVRVFGDDIIMPSCAVSSLVLLMSHCDLKVNASKTHYKGHFRESCGMDAFHGEDVTPLYLGALGLGKRAEDLVSWVDICNNAHFKGLFCLADAMVRKIPLRLTRLIPVVGPNVDLGILSLQSFLPAQPSGKFRFHNELQRYELLGLSARSKAVKRSRENYQNLLQFFLEEPSQEILWSSGYLVRTRLHISKRWVPI